MKKQSTLKIMKRLIVELKSLTPMMLLTIVLGVLGSLAAIAIPAAGTLALSALLTDQIMLNFQTALTLMITAAVLRGFLRYGEQLSGHYIAFKILAILRDKVFQALRKLAPAKLEMKQKGNLVSIITSDIELLEVFYAHTIAPVAIAFIFSLIIALVLAKINYYFGILAIVFYLIIGLVIPQVSSRYGRKPGMEYRQEFGRTNSFLLDSLRGLREILLFRNENRRLEQINSNSKTLNEKLSQIKMHEGTVKAWTDLMIMIAILALATTGAYFYRLGTLNVGEYVLAVVILASSFGPVTALSNLANTLVHTFACAQRIFDILDEQPVINEVDGHTLLPNHDIAYQNVSFSYENREIEVVKDIQLEIKKGDKLAIIGPSGSGKSTLIKLLMRFWDPQKGAILIGKQSLKTIATKSLRKSQSLVAQQTCLFNETIEENIRIGKLAASRHEVELAAQKAAVSTFIESLPEGYQTKIGELGGKLSSGERQRIGLARAFLHSAPIFILDEPTSNLDTLNEAQILKSIQESCQQQTVILISHRESTAAIAEVKMELRNQQLKIFKQKFN